MNAEWSIVEQCREVLEGINPVRKVTVRTPVRKSALAEADISVGLETEVGSLAYTGSVLRGIRPSRFDHWLLSNLARRPALPKSKRLIVMSDYVTPTIDQRLLDADVDYVDTAGNFLIRWPGKLYLHRIGQRAERHPSQVSSRLGKAAGLQILFVLLAEPQAAALPYRQIAYQSGVALGSAALVLDELRHKGFLVTRGNRRFLKRRQELLELWVDGYSAELRPRLALGRFQAPDREFSQVLRNVHTAFSETELDYAFTGGAAADILTHHYRGHNLTLFVSALPRDLLKELRWLPSPQGQITALRRFSPAISWDDSKKTEFRVAHPLLVYAELLHDGGERERETARILYTDQLLKLIETDD
jgi:hypothetical protein